MLCNPRNSVTQYVTASSSKSILANDICVGRIWKSPRDKSRCIEATLRNFNGHDFVDIRGLALDDQGRMVPNGQRLTVSAKQLGKFSKMIGDAYRKASQLGLTPRSS